MTYIIGEIGQNHNGSVDLAKVIIDLASREIKDDIFGNTLRGMDAVKLTKRDLTEELSQSQMNRIYDSPNSFGKTYGDHRAKLELSDQEHFEVLNQYTQFLHLYHLKHTKLSTQRTQLFQVSNINSKGILLKITQPQHQKANCLF